MLTQRVVGAVLITCLFFACAPIERGRSAPASTDVRLEAASHSAPVSASDHRTLQSDSVATAQEEIDTGPKTERAVGVVALVATLSALAFFVMVVYEVVKLVSN